MGNDRRIRVLHEAVSQRDTLAISPSISPSLHYDDERLCNAHGSIRRCYVKKEFLNGNLSLDEVTELYKIWRDDDEYFLLETDVPCIENIDVGGDSYFYARYPDEYTGYKRSHHAFKFIKMAKRGNDVYRYLVKERFQIFDDLQNIVFFDEDWGVKETRMLFFTLTYDTKRCDEVSAWLNIGKDWHNFCKRLTKEYGKIYFMRTWQSFENWYPHIHAIIIFPEHKFPVFVHVDKKGKKSYRIPRKDKDKISSFYHSNVDIKGVSNTEGAVFEIKKYITQDLCSDKGDKTNSMIWLFGLQSYAISRGFFDLIDKNISVKALKDIKADDLIKREMANCHQSGIKWHWVGVVRGKKAGINGCFWVVTMNKPPPRIIKIIEDERDRQKSLKWGR